MLITQVSVYAVQADAAGISFLVQVFKLVILAFIPGLQNVLCIQTVPGHQAKSTCHGLACFW